MAAVLLAASVIGGALAGALAPAPVAADNGLVCAEEVFNEATGAMKCTRYTTGNPGPGSGSGTVDPAARWDAFNCDVYGPWQAGYTIEFTTLSQIPPENYDVINADTGAPGYRFLEEGVDYFSVLVHCGHPAAPPGGVIITVSGPELNPGPDPLVLREEALARVVIDDPPAAANPPLDDPGRFGVVHIPTWFWLDPVYWTPITESATDPAGTLTVTVTATPVEALWDPGDGSGAVTCADAGTAWRAGLPDTATTCAHTYTSSSADQAGARYDAEVSVTWEFTWAIDGVDQGPFGTADVATAFTYAVGEIQAIET